MGIPTARNGKIDLLRFIFSICVVLNHAKYIMPDKTHANLFSGYSLAVEFFFLVSGYLMMASIEKAEKVSALSLGRETGAFLLKKFKALYPEVAISYLVTAIVTAVATGTAFTSVLGASWFEGFLLISTGLFKSKIMLVSWYASSMILCMALLYPLLRKYKDMALRVILPILAVVILGWLYQNYGSIKGPMKWTGITIKGNFRALAELSLGALCYCATKKLKELDFTAFGKVLLAVVELGIYAVYILYMAKFASGLRDLMMLPLLGIAVIITFSGKSFGHEIFNNRVCTFLGKYSLSICFSHYVFCHRIGNLLPFFNDLGWKRRLVVYVATAFVVGLIVMLVSNLIRKFGPKIGAGFKKLMTKEAPAEN